MCSGKETEHPSGANCITLQPHTKVDISTFPLGDALD
jgi:hypothetical protein